jgi:hypothetical protein
MLALVMLFSREITGGVTPMRSATCAFVRLSCLRHSASSSLSFPYVLLPAMQRDIHRPASTRYAVLYGLPVFNTR